VAKTKKEKKKNIAEGKVFIQATFNNTIVTITDLAGNAISWASGAKARDQGLREVVVFVKGPGVGSEAAIRAFGILGIRVRSIKDVTPIPHNGCRPPKKRRV
jgi:small subunit ribosomal protein S11